MSEETLFEFPCEFPVKIMGLRQDGFAQAIAELVQRHAPEFDPAAMTMRPSKEGKYLALTCTIQATSKEQLDALYRDLTAHPWVKMAL